jgi:hypothetical protein
MYFQLEKSTKIRRKILEGRKQKSGIEKLNIDSVNSGYRPDNLYSA